MTSVSFDAAAIFTTYLAAVLLAFFFFKLAAAASASCWATSNNTLLRAVARGETYVLAVAGLDVVESTESNSKWNPFESESESEFMGGCWWGCSVLTWIPIVLHVAQNNRHFQIIYLLAQRNRYLFPVLTTKQSCCSTTQRMHRVGCHWPLRFGIGWTSIFVQSHFEQEDICSCKQQLHFVPSCVPAKKGSKN